MSFYSTNDKTSDIWLTPPNLINSLGKFDLDPCCPNNLKWKTAENYYSLENEQDGLLLPWNGRVFLNPPYSNWGEFVKKLSEHGNGICLIFARTETRAFFNYIWDKADSILFIKKRVRFFNKDGKLCGGSTAPSVLIAYGKNNTEALEKCGVEGKLIYLK
jgi:hypothetical protein